MTKFALKKQTKLLFIFAILLASCNKDLNLDKWEPEMLLPIVKASASVKDVADLRDKSFVQQIPAIDVGYPIDVRVTVPPTQIGFVGPYSYTMSEYFNSVEVDSAVFDIELTNAFPIPISKGTKIVFRSSPETASAANIIYEHVLTQDVPAGGSYPKFSDIVTHRTISSRIFLFLENFTTAGGVGVTFGTQPSELKFEIKFLSVYKAAINTNREYGVSDTTEMQLESDVADYDDSTADGMLKLFINSSMPVNFSYQMYFLDETKSELIDSLYYGEMLSPGCHTDASGSPVDSVERKFEIVLTPDRIRNLKRAKYMAFRLSGNTNGYSSPVVYIDGNCHLQIQITGDVKLKVGALLPG